MKRPETDPFDTLDETERSVVPARRGGPRPSWLPLLVAVAGVGGAGAWWLLRKPPAAPVEVAPVATPVPLPEVLPGLPPLAERDALVRRLVGALSALPQLQRWLSADDLLGRFVGAVESVAAGRSPAEQLRGVLPSGSFAARGPKRRRVVDPRSFAAYDVVADVFTSMQPQAAAEVYRALDPMFEAAHREVARPGTSFADSLSKAIDHLLATPIPSGEILLVESGIFYAYADPELEGLSRAQKQLLRLGPANARRIQTHLRAVAAALQLHVAAAGD